MPRYCEHILHEIVREEVHTIVRSAIRSLGKERDSTMADKGLVIAGRRRGQKLYEIPAHFSARPKFYGWVSDEERSSR